MNSLAPTREIKAPFLKKNHVSSNYIHRPGYSFEDEDWLEDELKSQRVWNSQFGVYDIYEPYFNSEMPQNKPGMLTSYGKDKD